jgi:hypothetical protein
MVKNNEEKTGGDVKRTTMVKNNKESLPWTLSSVYPVSTASIGAMGRSSLTASITALIAP